MLNNTVIFVAVLQLYHKHLRFPAKQELSQWLADIGECWLPWGRSRQRAQWSHRSQWPCPLLAIPIATQLFLQRNIHCLLISPAAQRTLMTSQHQWRESILHRVKFLSLVFKRIPNFIPAIQNRFPMARRPVSKNNKTPRSRKKTPNPPSPIPNFCVSVISIILSDNRNIHLTVDMEQIVYNITHAFKLLNK